MKIIIITLLLFSLIGCKFINTTRIEDRLDELEKPVYIVSIGDKGSVLLRDVNGKCLVIPSGYYMSNAIAGSLKAGDLLIPKTNSTE